MEVMELVERAKTRAGLPSDYALAKAMDIERQVISQWKKGSRHPSNEEAVQLATLAGLDEMQVIAEIELRTAKNEKKREFWQHFLEKRGAVATVGLCALGVALIATPQESSAEVLHLQNYDETNQFSEAKNIHYANFKTRKMLIVKACIYKIKSAFLESFINNALFAFSR